MVNVITAISLTNLIIGRKEGADEKIALTFRYISKKRSCLSEHQSKEKFYLA